MPTFSQRGPGSIADSFASMLKSSGDLTPVQLMAIEGFHDKRALSQAQAAHANSSAEKVRLEAVAEKERQRLAADPAAAAEYAAMSAGITLPQGRQANDYVRGNIVEGQGPVRPGIDAQPTQPAGPPHDLSDAQIRQYQGALATLLGTRMATGKTNAEQMAKATGATQEQGTRTMLATPGLDIASRIAGLESIGSGGNAGAVAPNHQNAAGTSVVNAMTGATTTPDTMTARVENALTGAKTKTEGERQGELGARTKLHGSQKDVADATAADIRAGRPRTYKPGDPMQAEKRFSDMTVKEYENLPRAERKAMSLSQYQDKRRTEIEGRLKAPAGQGHVALGAVYDDAMSAIQRGKDPIAVRKRFKELTGVDLPEEDTAN